MSDVKVEWLSIAGSIEAWRAIGLAGRDDADGSWFVPLFGTSLRIVERAEGDGVTDAEQGIVGWALSGVGETDGDGRATRIDGLATDHVSPVDPTFAQHPLGAGELDHVVVLTDDLSRTTTAIAEATGCELKRVREVGEMRQGFHRIGRGGLIVEVVARPDVPEGPASFWGIVLNVEDLDAACELLGDLIGPPKDAVQPGRRIATMRREANLGVPVALMSRDRR